VGFLNFDPSESPASIDGLDLFADMIIDIFDLNRTKMDESCWLTSSDLSRPSLLQACNTAGPSDHSGQSNFLNAYGKHVSQA
jgi:hypothetical protein